MSVICYIMHTGDAECSRLSKLYALICFIHSVKYYHYWYNTGGVTVCAPTYCEHFGDEGGSGGIFGTVSTRLVDDLFGCDGSRLTYLYILRWVLSLVGYIDG